MVLVGLLMNLQATSLKIISFSEEEVDGDINKTFLKLYPTCCLYGYED
jgi:hypothetical protein